MKYISLSILMIMMLSSTINAQTFTLHENGITILCDAANVGDSGEVSGVTYTKRTKDQITQENASITCTSGITNMSNLFDAEGSETPSTFNEDISHWDLSSVTTTKNMFHLAVVFNQDVSAWDVSSVTDMGGMFSSAYKFNQDLSSWDVSNVTDMSLIFSNAYDFNSPLDTWDVSKVTSMHNMFGSHFNQPIGSWDVSSVIDMSGMFQGSKFNHDISGWDVSNVTNMSHMFAYTQHFNQPLNDWNVSNVKEMNSLFAGTYYDQPLDKWDVSNVTNMSGTFALTYYSQDISSWDVSNVEIFTGMFRSNTAFDYDISNWDISKAKEMSGMFEEAGLSIDNYSNVLDKWSNLDLQPNVQFDAGYSQYYPHVQVNRDVFTNTFGWDINDNGVGSYFKLHENGITILCTQAEVGDIGTINGIEYTKRTRDQITTDNASTTCTSGMTDLQYLFHDNARTQQFNANISHWDVSQVATMQGMFMYAEYFNQNLNYWDVSNVTDMALMFDGASSFNSNLDKWDVSNVTDMGIMFHASGFNQDISSWDVSNVTNMHRMFHASPFNQNINSWNVSSVKNMAYLFAQNNFNQPLNDWDVSQVTTMSHMFNQNHFFNQNISKWDVSNVTDMFGMFAEATKFNQSINDWDVSSVNNLEGMFYSAISFNQPLDQWNVSKVKNMNVMFRFAAQFNKPLDKWDFSSVENINFMFGESAFDAINYSKLLISWASQNMKDSLKHEINQNYFIEAQEAREFLVNEKGWTLNDKGPIKNGILALDSGSSKQGFDATISVNIEEVQLLSDFYSVQFDLSLPSFVEFIGIDSSSINNNYSIQVNEVNSIYKFALASDSLIDADAHLFDIIIRSDSLVTGTVKFQNALFNASIVDSLEDGIITIDKFISGDIDDSGDITAYDAAIVLNRSVGTNIIESSNPLPWENWRTSGADVDGDGQLLAMDATLILKKVVELIDEFPDIVPPIQDVIIEVTNRGLKFSAPESIAALNIILPKVNDVEIRDPEIFWDNSSLASHSNGTFDLAIASSNSTIGDILELPLYVYTNDEVTFDIITYTNNTKKVHSVTVSGLTVNNEDLGSGPIDFALAQNYPNPFNPNTQIEYALPEAAQVSLEVFNATGQKVATLVDTHQPAGVHTASFDASQLSSRVYLYKLTTPGFSQTKKMLLIK